MPWRILFLHRSHPSFLAYTELEGNYIRQMTDMWVNVSNTHGYLLTFFFPKSRKWQRNNVTNTKARELFWWLYLYFSCGLEELVAVPETKKPNSFTLNFHSSLSNCPGMDCSYTQLSFILWDSRAWSFPWEKKNFQRGIASHIHTHWFTGVQWTRSRAEKFSAWCLSRNGKAPVEYTCYEDSLGIDAAERARALSPASKEDIQFYFL